MLSYSSDGFMLFLLQIYQRIVSLKRSIVKFLEHLKHDLWVHFVVTSAI